MAYNQTQLLDEIRILFLPDIPTTLLPDNVIILLADKVDNDSRYTGRYNYILWLTTLRCLDYLIAKSTVTTGGSGSSAKSTRKEKSGDWEITVTTESSDSNESAGSAGYENLKQRYLENPDLFGIVVEASSDSNTGLIMFGGVSKSEYYDLKSDLDRLFYNDEWDYYDEQLEEKKVLKI